MRFALRELRRRPGRFATATLILTLIAILLMFLGSLLDGLITSSTGAIRAQNGDVLVYSDASRASLARSLIGPDLRAEIESVPGVDQTGGVGLVQLGARIPGAGARDLAAVALFGIEIPPIGVPEVPPTGQVYADEILRADGVEVGTELLLGPARSPVEVIGFVSDASFIGQGSLWADATTWRTVLEQNRPGARVGDGVFQALLVRTDTGTAAAELAAAIDTTTGTTEALSVTDAANALPGVEEQQGTFNQIIGVTLVIAVVVIGLFFALITVERTSLYGVLKALGARSTTLFAGLMAQAAVVTVIASAIAATALVALGLAIPPGGLPLDVTAARIALSTALLLFAAIAGCAFSLRRILRIDPASAIGSGP
jgi:putative ABC transport system permease protein